MRYKLEKDGYLKSIIIWDGVSAYTPPPGHTISPDDGIYVYEPEIKTTEERIAEITNAIQNLLDTKARERNYDGILSMCSYVASAHPNFAAEAQAGVYWRDDCWAKGYEILNDVMAGRRAVPTVEEVLSELPSFTWPVL